MKSEKVVIDFEKSLGPWLGRTVKMADYHLLEAFQHAGLDLTKEQMVVLKRLVDKDGLHQNELAFLTLRDKSSLARLLSKMEAKDYIVRKQNVHDKRIKEVFITSKGHEIFNKTRPVIKSVLNIMEHDISLEEKEQIIKILKRVQSNFTAKTASL